MLKIIKEMSSLQRCVLINTYCYIRVNYMKK